MSANTEIRVGLNEPQWTDSVVPAWIVPLAGQIATASVFDGGAMHLALFPVGLPGEEACIKSLEAARDAKGSPLKVHVVREESASIAQLKEFFDSHGWPLFDHAYPKAGASELCCHTVGQSIRVALRTTCVDEPPGTAVEEDLLDVVPVTSRTPDAAGGKKAPAPSEFREKLGLLLLEKFFLAAIFVVAGFYANYRIESFKGELGKQTEAYKANLGKQVEDYKTDLGKTLENYKTNLNEQLETYKAVIGKQLETYKAVEARRAEVARKGITALETIWTEFRKFEHATQELLQSSPGDNNAFGGLLNTTRKARQELVTTLADNEIWLPAGSFEKLHQQIENFDNEIGPTPQNGPIPQTITQERKTAITLLLRNIKEELLQTPTPQP